MEELNKNNFLIIFDDIFPSIYSPFRYEEYTEYIKYFENVIIAPIYAARETNTFNVSESMLVDKIKTKNKNVIYLDTYDKIKEYIKNNVHEKDLVISIGAGDANKIVKELVSN